MRVKPWMALVAILSFVKLIGAFVPPLQVAMEMQFRVCLQVASARPQGTIGVLNSLGLALKLLLFGIFSAWVMQSKEYERQQCFFLNIVCFLAPQSCRRGEKGFAPTLDPIQSFGHRVLASRSRPLPASS